MLKEVQTDRGKFTFLTTKWQSKGLIHQLTCPYTSKENGTVENRRTRVVEKGLALLLQATLPSSFWIHSFRTVVFTINRLPSKVLNYVSPYQLLYEKMPDYNFLRVFGCSFFPCKRILKHISLRQGLFTVCFSGKPYRNVDTCALILF